MNRSFPARRPLLQCIALTALLTVVLGWFAAGTAAAHATLTETDPPKDALLDTAPADMSLRFDAAVRVEGDGVKVLDPQGARVDGRAVSLDGGLRVRTPVDDGGQGTYTVSWRVTSEDGHTITGSQVFHVGKRTGGAAVDDGGSTVGQVLGWLGRALALLGGCTLLGGAVVLALAGGANAPGPRWFPVAGAAVIVGALLELMSRSVEYTGRSPLGAIARLGSVVSAGRPGWVLGVRTVAFLVAGLLVLVPATRSRRVGWAVAAGVALALAPIGGHAATASPAAVAVVLDVAHVVAVALWVGGLLTLWAVARTRPGVPDDGVVGDGGPESPASIASAVSRVSLVAAPIVVVTGGALGWWHSGSGAALTETPYGRLVLAKAVGALGLIALGWWHRRHLADVVTRWISTLRVEALGGVALIGLASVLVAMPPASDQLARPFRGASQAGDVMVVLQVQPGRRGANDLHLYFQDLDGQLRGVDAAEVRVGSDSIPERKVGLTTVTAGHAVAPGVALTTSGVWNIDVAVIQRGRPGSTTFEVPIP